MNGLEKLSKLSGIAKPEMQKIWEEIQENKKKLNSCSFHEFKLNSDQQFNNLYICQNCKGTVRITEKLWYEQGIAHAQKKEVLHGKKA